MISYSSFPCWSCFLTSIQSIFWPAPGGLRKNRSGGALRSTPHLQPSHFAMAGCLPELFSLVECTHKVKESQTHFLLLSKSTSPKGTLKQLHPKFWEFLCRLYPSLMDKDFNPSFDKSRQISSLFAYTWIPVWTHRRHSTLSHQLVNSERASLVFSQQGHPREGILCLGTWEGHDTEPRKHLNTHSRYPGLISLQNNVGIQPEGAASKRLLWIYSRI